MTSLLTAEDLAAIKEALKDVTDTFFTKDLTIQHRVATLSSFGEKATHTYIPYSVQGLYEFTRYSGGKYHTVNESPKGQEQTDGWRFYIWKEAVDLLGPVDPETDKVVMDGKEYVIRFWAPSALFAELGELLYELEISYDTTTRP